MLNLRIPKAVETLVMGCLAKLPSDRPQTVSEVLQALDAAGRTIWRRSAGCPPDQRLHIGDAHYSRS